MDLHGDQPPIGGQRHSTDCACRRISRLVQQTRRTVSRSFAIVLFSCLVCLGGGCGQSQPPAKQGTAPQQRSPKVETYGEADLTCKRGNYLPPIAALGLEIAGPQGWAWRRETGYVVVFAPKEAMPNTLPHILVEVGDNEFPELTAVTKENVGEFADRVSKRIAGKSPNEEVRPIILGDNVFVRYARRVRKNNAPATRQSLETVAGDQLFTIHVDDYEGKFDDNDRHAAYVVGLSMIFSTAGESSASDEPDEAESQPTPTPPSD